MKYITKFLSLAVILIISACHSSQQISNQPRDKQQWLIENGKKIQRMSRQDYCKLIVNINYGHGPYLAQNNDGNSGWKR